MEGADFSVPECVGGWEDVLCEGREERERRCVYTCLDLFTHKYYSCLTTCQHSLFMLS